MHQRSTIFEVPLTAPGSDLREQVSIRHLLAAQAARIPDAIALAAPGRAPLTYHRLVEHIDYVTEALRGMGVGRERRVALVLPQGPEMAVVSVAVAAAATCAPINPAYRSAEYESYLTQFNIGALIVQTGLESEARAVAERQGIPVLELSPSHEAEAGLFAFRGPDRSCPSDSGGAPGSDDIALILPTSGTTSRPKIVPLTHRNLCTSAINIGRSLGLGEDDRCLNMMPLFHIHALMVTLSSLVAGGSVVCAQTPEMGQFFRLLDEFSPTWYSAVPTIHLSILSRASHYSETIRRRPLRFIRSSSSALSAKTAADLEAMFTAPVIEAYGMTEAAHQIATNRLPPGARKFGSVGPAAGPEVAVMDESGNRLSSGERGEIVIRGASVMSGYEGDPHINDTVFTKGWFRTGDEGFIDDDGYIFISGRLKEVINRGGQKIAPREVDEVLMSHPAVAQAVTFAMPHTTLGEDVAAAIVLREGMAATEAEIREFAHQRLAGYKVPRRVLLVGEIPRGATGKLQRLGLADRLGVLPGDSGLAEEKRPPDPLEHELVRIWEEVLGVRPIGITDDFFELGGHSLLAAEMMDQVEQACGYRVPLATLFGGATLEHLATALRERKISVERRSRLVEVQGRGSRPPFVFLHGDWGGGGFYCLKLARFLGEDQPFYALPPHGLDGEPAPQSIEAMAADHLETLRAAQPSGPYLLGGLCNGALVAWEMARRLRAAGQAVDLLILVEPPPPRLDLRWLHRVVTVLHRLRGLGLDESMTRFLQLEERWRQLTALMFGGSGVGRSGGFQAMNPPVATPRTLDRRTYLDAHYRRGMDSFHPRRYRGRVTIIWARENREYLERQRVDPTLPWRRLASEVALHVVPGSHMTMMTDHVEALAECLRGCLDHAQSRCR
jgi:acyl-CoA synthetase (AMP-forming)/AMP-acid ligase II/thioesterase domain-containing protein